MWIYKYKKQLFSYFIDTKNPHTVFFAANETSERLLLTFDFDILCIFEYNASINHFSSIVYIFSKSNIETCYVIH